MQGWIKLHRKIQDHWLYQEKRKFSRFEAWIDLLMMVNHEDSKVVLGNEIVEVKRGQRITSIRQLCDRWGWSNTKVTQFLKLLETDGMIRYESDRKKTVITIVNYDFYQGRDDSKTTENRRENDRKQTRKHTNKNEKNEKNDKEDISTTTEPDPLVLFEQTLCRLSEIQRKKLIEWEKDFGGKREILNEAILIADNRNRRSFGFVEFLLKEWANNNLDSLEKVRAYEKEKFKSKSYSKRPVRTEKVPDWFNARELPNKEPTELSPEEIADLEEEKRKLQERLQKYKNQEVLI